MSKVPSKEALSFVVSLYASGHTNAAASTDDDARSFFAAQIDVAISVANANGTAITLRNVLIKELLAIPDLTDNMASKCMADIGESGVALASLAPTAAGLVSGIGTIPAAIRGFAQGVALLAQAYATTKSCGKLINTVTAGISSTFKLTSEMASSMHFVLQKWLNETVTDLVNNLRIYTPDSYDFSIYPKKLISFLDGFFGQLRLNATISEKYPLEYVKLMNQSKIDRETSKEIATFIIHKNRRANNSNYDYSIKGVDISSIERVQESYVGLGLATGYMKLLDEELNDGARLK